MSQNRLALTRRKKIVIGLLVLVSAVMAVVLFSISAASGQLRLTSSSASVVQGRNFTVNVNVSSDVPINVAHSKVTYDPAVISLQAINYADTPYTQDTPEHATGSGFVTISRFKIGAPYPSGNFKIATLTFRANNGSGNTTVNVSQNESALYDTESANALTSVSGVSVSFTKPATTTPTPDPTPTPGPTGSNEDETTNGGTTTQTQNRTNPQPTNTSESTDGENDAQPALITEGTPDDLLPAPGTSQRSSSLSIATRIGLIVRNIIPVIIVLAVMGVIGWIIFKRFGHHSNLTGFTPAQAAGPGVVFDGSHTIKTNNDQNQNPPQSPIQ